MSIAMMGRSLLTALPRAALRAMRLYAPYYLFRYGYLRDMCWYSSYHNQKVTGAKGEPIPWYTYASIHFISERVTPDMTVFEYGSGNSTFWWASRVRRVVSIEHSKTWYNELRDKIPPNVDLIYVDNKDIGTYSKMAANYTGEIDIVVIDGRNRVCCAKNSLPGMKPNGVIIWDNTERKKYEEGYAYLAGEGFRRIDFTGMGPAQEQGWTTSVFYRQENCFGI